MITIASCDIEKYRSLNRLEKWFFRNGGINWMVIMPFVNMAGLCLCGYYFHWYYYPLFLFALLSFIGWLCIHYDGLIHMEEKCECGANMKYLGTVGDYEMSTRYRCESCNKEVDV